MTAGGSVTADELVRALRQRSATLPAEIATFIVLEGCEQMLHGGPRELADLTRVRISEQGTVALSGPAADDGRGARDLHRLLGLLLASSGPSQSPALVQLAEQGPRGGAMSLRALRDELEAALVPLNRNASRRVLARFARDAASAGGGEERAEVDARLGALLRGDPDNDVDAREAAAREARSLRSLANDLALPTDEPHYLEGAVALPGGLDTAARAAERRTRSMRPSFAPAAREDESTPSLRPPADTELDELVEAAPSTSRKLLLGIVLVACAAALIALVFSLRGGERVANGASGLEALDRAQVGTVIVRVAEPGAQVLRYVGDAPVSVPRLPVAVAHEFVAIQDGFAPARVLVPADADWEAGEGGARFEVALQLEPRPEAVGDAARELGPSLLQGRMPASEGQRLGSVRVVATPRGARVYRLVGFAPQVRLERVPRTAPVELLVYDEGHTPTLHTVAPSDFATRGDEHVAEVSITLSKR